jgi:hypothetical protein
VRAPAFIDGDEIVLTESEAEEYTAFGSDHATGLLLDLGNLAKIGKLVKGTKSSDFRLTEPERALEFAETHGLLWHGPRQVGTREFREPLKKWFFTGLEFLVTTGLYFRIRQSQEEGSAEPVRSFLRRWRDARVFKHISLSDNDTELLDFACIQLAERITRGMADCTPTLFAASGLLRDGVKVGGAGDFRFVNGPSSLVGAAHYRLAFLVSNKKPIGWCEECGEVLVLEDPRQRYHKKCGDRKRQRERRQRLKTG